LNFFIITP